MIIPAQTEGCPVIEVPSVEQLLSEGSYAGFPRTMIGDVREVKIAYRTPVEQIAGFVGERIAGDEMDVTTDHAWLVVMGQFAQVLGLVKDLEAVPIEQKQGPKCTPQTKLIEFLIGILGGIEYLQDLNLEAQPIHLPRMPQLPRLGRKPFLRTTLGSAERWQRLTKVRWRQSLKPCDAYRSPSFRKRSWRPSENEAA